MTMAVIHKRLTIWMSVAMVMLVSGCANLRGSRPHHQVERVPTNAGVIHIGGTAVPTTSMVIPLDGLQLFEVIEQTPALASTSLPRVRQRLGSTNQLKSQGLFSPSETLQFELSDLKDNVRDKSTRKLNEVVRAFKNAKEAGSDFEFPIEWVGGYVTHLEKGKRLLDIPSNGDTQESAGVLRTDLVTKIEALNATSSTAGSAHEPEPIQANRNFMLASDDSGLALLLQRANGGAYLFPLEFLQHGPMGGLQLQDRDKVSIYPMARLFPMRENSQQLISAVDDLLSKADRTSDMVVARVDIGGMIVHLFAALDSKAMQDVVLGKDDLVGFSNSQLNPLLIESRIFRERLFKQLSNSNEQPLSKPKSKLRRVAELIKR